MNKLIIFIISFSTCLTSQENKLLKNRGFFTTKTSGMDPNNNNNFRGHSDNHRHFNLWVYKILKIFKNNPLKSICLSTLGLGVFSFFFMDRYGSSQNNNSSRGNRPIDLNGIPENFRTHQHFLTTENPSTVLSNVPQNFRTHQTFVTMENPSTVLIDNNKTTKTPRDFGMDLTKRIPSQFEISVNQDQWDLLNSLNFFDNKLAEKYFKWEKDFDGSLKLLEKQSLETIVKTIVEDKIHFIQYAMNFWINNQSNDGDKNRKITRSLKAFCGKFQFFFNECCQCLQQVPTEQRKMVLDGANIGHIILRDSDNLRNIFSDEEQKKVIDFKGLMELTAEEKSLTTTLKPIPQLHPIANRNSVRFSIDLNEETESIEIHRIVFQFCRADGDGFCLYNSLNQDADYLNKSFQQILNRPANDIDKQKIIFIIALFLYTSDKEGFYCNSIVESMDQPHNIFHEIKLINKSKSMISNQKDILLAQLKDQLGNKNTEFLMERKEILENYIFNPVEVVPNPEHLKLLEHYKMPIFQKAIAQRDEEIREYMLYNEENPVKAHFNKTQRRNDLDKFKLSEDLENKFAAIKDELSEETINFLNGPWIQWQKQMEGNSKPITKALVDYINGLKNIWIKIKDVNNADFYKNFINTMLDKKKKLFGGHHFIKTWDFFPLINIFTQVVDDNFWKINVRWSELFKLNNGLKKSLNNWENSSSQINEGSFILQHGGIHYDRQQGVKDEQFLINIDVKNQSI